MEAREGIISSSGVTVLGSDAPSDYHVASRNAENPSHFTGSTPPQVMSPVSVTAAPPSTAAGGMITTATTTTVKKKRGRPRKYAPDGSAAATNVVVMSPKPISSLVPSPVIDFSSDNRQGKVRQPTSSVVKPHQPRTELENNLSNGDWVSCSVGASFTPHIITVNAGEDVTMKVISFSQQGPRAICILSANGVISSVTLRQPDSSGGTLTYEGRFEILSLTGSFMPSENGGMRNRSGGMSVSLASPDGRVVGGGVAGLLVAAGPIQIVVGSFLAGNQHEHTIKKQKPEHVTTTTQAAAGFTITSGEMVEPYNSSSSFRGENNWPAPPPPESSHKPTDINITLPG